MEKVFVGMSGGVDSGVTALLLKNQGFKVLGVTLSVHNGNSDSLVKVCGSKSEADDAAKMCEQLGIEHMLLDYSDDFKKQVKDFFVRSYLMGYTPNPCIECNCKVKFSKLLENADKCSAKYIATGHYANVCYDENTGRYLLKKAKDLSKDQSYVLYKLGQDVLRRLILPLGNMQKSQVREIAAKDGLISANKPDSQDICFVPEGNYADFIEEYTSLKSEPGNFVDINGNIIGKHNGIIRYTVGQRKGLGVAFGKPMFVKDKCAETNTVILADNSQLFAKHIYVDDINYIMLNTLTQPIQVTAKLRYSAQASPAKLTPTGENSAILEFSEPQRAATKGQHAVFYIGDTVLGGGIITDAR